ncbi:hypothetical protein ACFYNY_34400 [Streptomyces sp. NPDC006530]|uniref:hypothetical protein n=1 Tax=Streptomyces sp. NPDC006530 TaxID=3364750 RepID=UPI0036D10582
MRTERLPRSLARLLCMVAAMMLCVGGSLAQAPVASADDKPEYHATYGPKSGKPAPDDFAPPGVDPQGNWCNFLKINDKGLCRAATAEEISGLSPCENADGTGQSTGDCGESDAKAFEKKKLEEWRAGFDHKNSNYEELNKKLTQCVDKGRHFKDCLNEYGANLPPDAKGPGAWVAGKISEMASNALKEAANYIGKAVVWLLQQFAAVFNNASTIDLSKVGIGSVTGMMTALSVVIAAFLLLLQFGKVAISQRGEPAATALAGLAKWAVISSVYVVATETALSWSDAVSTWIINLSFQGGGSGEADATAAMQHQLGTMFGGLITGGGGAATAGGALIAGESVTAAAVGVIIVVGIVIILAIAALWIEVLLRQAGIMILMATMPIVLVGQMNDATSEWWPKARNALIALVLMKPMITICFAIGFGAMAQGQGVQNMIVGLVIFLMACFAWPSIAKFMTFSTVGGGAAMFSGLMSSAGSSAGSIAGGYRPEMSGAGAVGGGSAYTRALEKDNTQTQASGSNASGGGTEAAGKAGKAASKGRFGGIAGPIGLGLQAMAVGKDILESGMNNTAGHAGLDAGGGGGRHVVIPPRGSHAEAAPAPTSAPSSNVAARSDAAPVTSGPTSTDVPRPGEG